MNHYSSATCEMYFGSAEEVRPIYKSLCRAYHDSRCDFAPSHFGRHFLKPGRKYGLDIDFEHKNFVLMSEEVVDRVLMSGEYDVFFLCDEGVE